MAKNQKYLSETAEQKRLKHVIEEELGINNEVKFLSNSLTKKIAEEYKPGYTLKITPFSEKCGEYTIFFDLTDYPKRSIGEKNSGGFKGITFFSPHIMKITGFTVNGKIPEDNLSEVLQHELKHIFDLYKSSREGFFKSAKDANIYGIAARQATNKSLSDELRAIGYAIYLSYKFESQAFESGTYAYLMKQDMSFIGDEVDAVKGSMYYKRLMFVRYAYDFIMNNEEEAGKIAKTIYGKTFKWLKKTVTAALNSTRRQIGRAMAKVREDYDWTHEGNTTVWA